MVGPPKNVVSLGSVSKHTHLQESDEIGEDHPVDVRELVHDGHRALRIQAELDALVVELGGDERLVQLAVPQLQQGGGHVRVVAGGGRDLPLVHLQLQSIHLVNVTGDPAGGTHRLRDLYK